MKSVAEVPFSVLEQEYNDRKAKLDELLAKQNEVRAELELLDKEIDSIQNPPEIVVPTKNKKEKVPAPAGSSASAAVVLEKAANGAKRPMREWAYSVLRQYRKPMHINEIAKILLDRGFRTSSKRFEVFCASVASVITKDERFTRSGPNTFDLVDRLDER